MYFIPCKISTIVESTLLYNPIVMWHVYVRVVMSFYFNFFPVSLFVWKMSHEEFTNPPDEFFFFVRCVICHVFRCTFISYQSLDLIVCIDCVKIPYSIQVNGLVEINWTIKIMDNVVKTWPFWSSLWNLTVTTVIAWVNVIYYVYVVTPLEVK